MHCVTKKSMDDEGLRFQIINLLKSAGASSDRDLNNEDVHNVSSLLSERAGIGKAMFCASSVRMTIWKRSWSCGKICFTTQGLILSLGGEHHKNERCNDKVQRSASAMKSSLRKNLKRKNTTDLLDDTLEGK